jgi:hypothetical protein
MAVRVEAHDRAGLERLIRYCARSPFALHRLHAPAGPPARLRGAQLLARVYRLDPLHCPGDGTLRIRGSAGDPKIDASNVATSVLSDYITAVNKSMIPRTMNHAGNSEWLAVDSRDLAVERVLVGS